MGASVPDGTDGPTYRSPPRTKADSHGNRPARNMPAASVKQTQGVSNIVDGP